MNSGDIHQCPYCGEIAVVLNDDGTIACMNCGATVNPCELDE